MWSGPRNISTAMMRSFENRPDTFVSDEPFYGFYLANTDIDHPGRKEVLRSMETDWDTVSKSITGLLPNEEKVWFQKHMAQHNLPGADLSWTSLVTNCFLIRDPREVIISYHKKYDVNRAELLGYPQQIELYRMLTEKVGVEPTIVDAKDILKDPEGMLKKVCIAIGIPFMEEMLSWSAGPRETDGVWASTGTAKWRHQQDSSRMLKKMKKYLMNWKGFMKNVSYIMIPSIVKGFINS
jgi:hypothetical protein